MSSPDLLDSRPVLRPDIALRIQGRSTRRQVRLSDPVDHRSHDLGWSAYEFATLLDGRLTLRDAVTEYSRSRPQAAFSTTEALRIVHWLREAGLLAGERPRASDSAARLNPFVLRCPLLRGEHWSRALVPLLGGLFSLTGFVLWFLLVLLALLIGGAGLGRLSTVMSDWFMPENWLGLAVLWTLLKVLHEAGHAVAATRAGAPPREAGIMLLYFAPLAYVDLSETWRLTSRTARVITSLAGVYVETFVAALALIVWSFVESPVAEWWLANLVLLSSVNTLVFNLNPLARLDGYFVVTDLLDAPNLGPNGRADLQRRLVRCLCGPRSLAWMGPIREPLWVCLFALASQVWSVLLLVSVLATLASAWSGAGLALTMLALVLLAGPAVVSIGSAMSRTLLRSPVALGRALTILSAGVGIVAAVSLIPSPWVPTAACVVEFQDGATLRAPEDAFVETVHVQAGVTVRAGEILVTLRSDSLLADQAEAAAHAQICRMREHLALERHDPAAAKIFAREAETALASLQRINARLAALVIRAPRAGVVVSETLGDLDGTFVSTGTELLLVGDPAHKRLTALLAETEAMSLRSEQNDTLPEESGRARFQLTSGSIGEANLSRVDPRASTRLEYPALAASLGGPLAVRATSQSSDSSQELAAAHATLLLTLDPVASRAVELGETGRVSFTASHRPLAQTLSQALESWWNELRSPRRSIP